MGLVSALLSVIIILVQSLLLNVVSGVDVIFVRLRVVVVASFGMNDKYAVGIPYFCLVLSNDFNWVALTAVPIVAIEFVVFPVSILVPFLVLCF